MNDRVDSEPATKSVSSIRLPTFRWYGKPPNNSAVRWVRVEMSNASGVSGRSASVISVDQKTVRRSIELGSGQAQRQAR